METAEEPYRPPAELVRYHLRSALLHLLVQAPVQGKAALARLGGEVKSPEFPIDADKAFEVLKAGPLQRPKDALLREEIEESEIAFLEKPYTPLLLARRVREVLDGPPQTPSTAPDNRRVRGTPA